MNIQASFSNMQRINQMASRMESTLRASHQETVKHLEHVDAKQSKAAVEVIDNAVKTKATATKVKGNIVNVIV